MIEINHQEALELAVMKTPDSNLARCYIALRGDADSLRKTLEETRKIIVEVCGAFAVPLPEATLARVDAALRAARPGAPK